MKLEDVSSIFRGSQTGRRTTLRSVHPRIAGLVGGALLLIVSVTPAVAQNPHEDLTWFGSDTCLECHEDEDDFYEIHEEHIEERGIDCARCHNFSRG